MKPEIKIMKDLLQNIAMFGNLSKDELEILSNASKSLNLGKNQYLYNEKDETDNLYYIIDGIIKIGVYDENQDKEVIKNIFTKNTLFGDQAILGHKQYNSFAQVLSDEANVIAIPSSIFRYLMQSNFEFNMRYLESIGNKMRFTDNRIESFMLHDARFRIIEFIKDNANKFGQKVGLETLIKHPLTQQEIANYTGTSRQTVTTVLNELKKSNHIFLKRKSILVRDLEKIS